MCSWMLLAVKPDEASINLNWRYDRKKVSLFLLKLKDDTLELS